MTDRGADLVVVGAGLAGLVAARRAAELGLRVIVLEQGEDDGYPCNTRVSGGVLVVAHRPASTPAAELEPALTQVTFGSIAPELAALVANGAGPALDWLQAHGATFEAQEFHPGLLFTEVLAPTGLRATNVDWEGKGPDVLLRALRAAIDADGGEVLLGHRAEALLDVDGRVAGVRATTAGATQLTIRSAAVLLADGGFQGNRELVRTHIAPAADRVVLRAAPSGQGWGLRAAAGRGARLVHLDSFYGHLVSADALADDRLWPYPVLDPVAEDGMLVDRHGRRFADEAMGGVHLANVLARRADPFGYVVCDEAGWQGVAARSVHPPAVNPWLERSGGTVVEAPTLDQLGARLSLPSGALVAAWTERRPVDDGGPYRAVPVVPGISFTMGGPLVDVRARVLAEDGEPIPGLYAAGSCCGGFEGGAEVGYTGGLIRATVTALAAAGHLHQALAARGHRSHSSNGGRG